jgi:hypothetical protein
MGYKYPLTYAEIYARSTAANGTGADEGSFTGYLPSLSCYLVQLSYLNVSCISYIVSRMHFMGGTATSHEFISSTNSNPNEAQIRSPRHAL